MSATTSGDQNAEHRSRNAIEDLDGDDRERAIEEGKESASDRQHRQRHYEKRSAANPLREASNPWGEQRHDNLRQHDARSNQRRQPKWLRFLSALSPQAEALAHSPAGT